MKPVDAWVHVEMIQGGSDKKMARARIIALGPACVAEVAVGYDEDPSGRRSIRPGDEVLALWTGGLSGVQDELGVFLKDFHIVALLKAGEDA